MGWQRQPPASGRAAAAPQRVVVVGAGIGGLAAAIELARSGREVVVLERASTPGGKLREVGIGGHRLDAGPTVLTMRWVFDELFADAGARLDDHLDLRPAGILARHAWTADERLDLHADIERSVEAIAAFSSPAEAERYRAFCARSAAVYRTLDATFIRASRPSPASLTARAGWRGLPDLVRIAPFSTLWSSLTRQFEDPRLRQLFGRYATYCGSSPFLAPATLMLVAHVEQRGVWLVQGGMHRVAGALVDLAERLGVVFRFDCDVIGIGVAGGRATGATVAGRDRPLEFIAADAVVFNGDVAALGAGLLGAAAGKAASRPRADRRSLSAVTWNIVGRCTGGLLVRHNVFFGSDSAAEFDAIFRRGALPEDPTVYVCAQDRDDAGAPTAGGPERLLCLVNAPARGDTSPLDDTEIDRCRQRLDRVLARCGLTIDTDPASTRTTTPTDFDRLFPGSGGALYGQASHGWTASFSRPGARSRIPNLYLAGGSTHPGPGVPMAALSGRQAAASLMADRARDRASTARFPVPATPGGMSTP